MTELPKTLHELPKTIGWDEKVGSNEHMLLKVLQVLITLKL